MDSNLSMTEEPVAECAIRYQRDHGVDPKRKQKLGQEVRLFYGFLFIPAKPPSLDKAERNPAQGRQSDHIARRCADS
jgi:hypothetical protein